MWLLSADYTASQETGKRNEQTSQPNQQLDKTESMKNLINCFFGLEPGRSENNLIHFRRKFTKTGTSY